jgi:hypothetical protein
MKFLPSDFAGASIQRRASGLMPDGHVSISGCLSC